MMEFLLLLSTSRTKALELITFPLKEEAETEEEEVSVTIGFQVTDYLLRTRVRVETTE